MNNIITSTSGNLVIFEGPTRANWERSANGWRLNHIWPDDDEQSRVLRHLERGVGLLIIMDVVDTALLVHPDELSGFEGDTRSPVATDILEIHIPLLDWLPPRYRTAASRFRQSAAAQMAAVPVVLQPSLMLSDMLPGRFAIKLGVRSSSRSGHLVDGELARFVDSLFPAPSLRTKAQRRSLDKHLPPVLTSFRSSWFRKGAAEVSDLSARQHRSGSRGEHAL